MLARIILVVLLACTGPALGYQQGTITAPHVALIPGYGPALIAITISGPTAIHGINLNLQIGDGAWPEYHGGPKFLDVDLEGPGLLFHGASFGQIKVIITPQMLYATTVTPVQGQFISVPDGQTRVLARVLIEPGWDVGIWPLSLTSLNGPTDYADLDGVNLPNLVDGSLVVPEPASLVLAMVGGGLVLSRARVPYRR